MASSTFIKSIILFMLVLVSLCQAQKSASKPKALLLPVSKDPSTVQYITRLNFGTPSVPKTLVVDLGGRYTWIDCAKGYKSSTYKPGFCGSAPCSLAKSDGCSKCLSAPKPGCTTKNSTCDLNPENTVTGHVDFGELAMDKISLQSTDGSKPGPLNSVSDFIFSCATDRLVIDFARGAKGMLGLGRNPVGLPTQLASAFGGGFHRKFAICLPSKPKTNGVIFFGDSPYIFHQIDNKSMNIDVSSLPRLAYTKLYINPVSTAGAYRKGEQSTKYFVGVNSILVDRKPIRINSTLLSINNRGFGGVKISTVSPYTVLESSIYNAVVKAFDEALFANWNESRVKPVKPFKDCYTATVRTPLGVAVPDLAFVFENNVKWDIYGANSMVEISRDVHCLGFLDGGSNPRTSIVIGAHQLEDNLLQFDLAASKLAFTETLLWEGIECSNFKF
ncbi:hypothetical protein LWI28_015259 [Acer negundo]|uniref:Peptidase A1 domain-containing protein n=1 Tax=Acer negundo TaxID=4023 RepID=A0AAD5P0K4_ACENE|nr:hypothetical protein LWI28_015259 [Acer negundo]